MPEPKPQRSLPAVGEVVPDVTVQLDTAASLPLSALRARHNLVLVFLCGGRRCGLQLVDALFSHPELAQEESIVLPVLHGDPAAARALNLERWQGQLNVAADSDGSLHRLFGALAEEGYSDPALYITDRWGQIYAAIRELDGDALPTADEIVASLRHINHACEECDPGIDWPKDAA